MSKRFSCLRAYAHLCLALLATTSSHLAVSNSELETPEKPVHVECAYKGRVLMFSLQYPDKTALPCNVTYQRSNGAVFDIWKTDKKESFCEVQFQMVIGKMIRSGWECKEIELEEKKRAPRRDYR